MAPMKVNLQDSNFGTIFVMCWTELFFEDSVKNRIFEKELRTEPKVSKN